MAKGRNVESEKAPPKGLEPLTDWLTASRSTGLSYGGPIQTLYDL